MKNLSKAFAYSTLFTAMFLGGTAQAQIVELSASQDAAISAKGTNVYANFGALNAMSLEQDPNTQRILTKFDLSTLITNGLNSTNVQSAYITFKVNFNDAKWGNGKAALVDIHPLLDGWDEKNVTWNCTSDSDLTNNTDDCTVTWTGGNLGPVTASVDVSNIISGVIQFDVTQDVKDIVDGVIANNGWLIKKQNEARSGFLTLASRESADAPQLILNVDSAGNSTDVLPPEVTIATPASDFYLGEGPSEITAYYSDESGIGKVEVKYDGTIIAEANCIKTDSSISCPIPALTDGTHTVEVSVEEFTAGANGKTTTVTKNFIYYTPTTGSGATSRWFTGNGVPNDADGLEGDMYLDVASADVYQKTAAGWNFSTNIKGQTGDPGTSSWTDGAGQVTTAVNVGIGNPAPMAALDVAGNVIAAEPIVANHLTTKNYVDNLTANATSDMATLTAMNNAISTATTDMATVTATNTAISTATTDMATVTAMNNAIATATTDMATVTGTNAAIQTATTDMATLTAMNNAIATATTDMATVTGTNAAIQTATTDMATLTAMNNAIATATTDMATVTGTNAAITTATTDMATLTAMNNAIATATTDMATVTGTTTAIQDATADMATLTVMNDAIATATTDMATVTGTTTAIQTATTDMATLTAMNNAIATATTDMATVTGTTAAIQTATADMATVTGTNAAITTATQNLASTSYVDNSVSTATQGMATTSYVDTKTSGLASTGYVDTKTSGLASTGYVDNSVSTATQGMATTGYVDTKTSGLATTGYVDNSVSTATQGMATTGYVDTKTNGLASTSYVDTKTSGLATTGYVDTKTSGLATTGYVDTKTSGLATTGYVDTKTSGLATTGYVDTKTSGLATTGYVDNSVSTATQGMATTGYVDTKTSGLATTGYVDTKTSGLASTSYVDTKTSGLASTSYVDTKTTGLASTNYVDTKTTGLASTSYVDGKTNGLASTSYVDTKTNGLASTSYVDSKTNGLVSSTSMNSAIATATYDMATVTSTNTAISNATAPLASIDYVDAQVNAIAQSGRLTVYKADGVTKVGYFLNALSANCQGLIYSDIDTGQVQGLSELDCGKYSPSSVYYQSSDCSGPGFVSDYGRKTYTNRAGTTFYFVNHSDYNGGLPTQVEETGGQRTFWSAKSSGGQCGSASISMRSYSVLGTLVNEPQFCDPSVTLGVAGKACIVK